ncbi:hypothetical protein [Methanogenium cariaci]|uniref:hypothetical protein n=1 Tax=Methanogenium cariaci TaxID=2197 RepID=UPI0012F6ABAC|nr:hypothetical protein [Methanogenium cariaci]
MDLSGCSLTYATSERILTLQPNDTLISTTPPLPGRWTISDITSDGGDSPVIRFNERATIMVRIPESYLALPGERITVTLIPPRSVPLSRSAGPSRVRYMMLRFWYNHQEAEIYNTTYHSQFFPKTGSSSNWLMRLASAE